MAEHNLLGKEGEEQTLKYLGCHSYIIHDINWRYRHNELDIVAEKNGELVVVEVKTRSTNMLQRPEEAVDSRKIKRIVAATDVYIRKFDIDLPVRFDIITVVKDKSGTFTIEHIDNAFYSPLW